MLGAALLKKLANSCMSSSALHAQRPRASATRCATCQSLSQAVMGVLCGEHVLLPCEQFCPTRVRAAFNRCYGARLWRRRWATSAGCCPRCA